MSINNGQVTADPNPNVPAGTSGAVDVPAGTVQTGASDATKADPVTEFKQRLDKLEEDRRRQQSVYDRMIAAEQKKNQELQAQLEQLKVQGMDETQRTQYEAQSYKAKYEALLQEREAQQQIQEYATAFAETFKVPLTELDITSQEAVATSGWEAVRRKLEALEQATTAPSNPSQPKPTNQKVITGSGGVPRTKPSQAEMAQAIAQRQGKSRPLTTEEFYSYMERHPDEMNQWLQSE